MRKRDDEDQPLRRRHFDSRAEWLRHLRSGCMLPISEWHPDFQDAMKLGPKDRDEDDDEPEPVPA